METYIGIDFGGTKLLVGELDQAGNILASKRYETGALDQKSAAARLIDCLRDYKENVQFVGEPRGAGVGIVGVVDFQHGIWRTVDYREVNDIPLGEMVSDVLGVRTVIDNDVKSAVQAELRFGHGRESRDFIYINVGTGLAAGFVVDGRMLRGANNDAGEVGHMVLDIHSDVQCICGRKGCVEGTASGSGIDATVRRLAGQYDTRLTIPETGRVEVREVFRLADEGDEVCRLVTDRVIFELKEFVLNLIRVTDPDTIVLGGGLMSDGWLFAKLQEALLNQMPHGSNRRVVQSSLDVGLVGLIGAAANAMNDETREEGK